MRMAQALTKVSVRMGAVALVLGFVGPRFIVPLVVALKRNCGLSNY